MGKIGGGCFCGRIRYEILDEPFNPTLCHCADCRRVTSAPVVAWFSVRPAALAYLQGEPKTFASSAGVTRGFCADCGTALTYQRDDVADEIDVTTASLDQPELLPPEDETQHAEHLAWIEQIGRLPTFARARTQSKGARAGG